MGRNKTKLEKEDTFKSKEKRLPSKLTMKKCIKSLG